MHDDNSNPLNSNNKAETNNSLTRKRDFLKLSDAAIYYEVTGDGKGPAIIFAHGLSGNHLSWWQQVPYFSKNYKCITFAHRGFPPSSEGPTSRGPVAFGDDLAALIEHLELSQVCLVGQSMGGWACVEYAFQHPEKVCGIILTSTVGHLDDDTLTYPGLDEVSAWYEKQSRIKQALKDQGIEAAAGQRMAIEQPALHYLYREIDDFTTADFKSKIGPALSTAPTRPLTFFAKARFPILFIVGEEDILLPNIYAQAAASYLPNSRVVTVPKTGHSVYFERASFFNEIVEEFIVTLNSN